MAAPLKTTLDTKIETLPDPGRAPQDVYSSMTKLAEFTPDTSFLAEFGLTGINGPVKAAEMLRSDETIQLGIERMTGGLIAGKSRFSELVWKSRFTQYRKMIGEAAFGTYEDLMQALGVVSADSLDKNSRLRDGTELYRFTKAVLGDFLDDQEKVPEAFARREIIQFFEGFLGARKDPNNASRWKPIADIVAPIFDFWELGLKLENIFEFAREAVERDPSASSRANASIKNN